MLVRSMSPKVIAVDEIGFREDVEALEYVMNCGVKILATVHGCSMEEIRKKPILGARVGKEFFRDMCCFPLRRLEGWKRFLTKEGPIWHIRR